MDWQFMLRQLQHSLHGPWAERILGEIEYLRGIDPLKGERDRLLDQAVANLSGFASTGGLGEDDVARVEEILAPLGPAARSTTLTFLAHAHLDMNWMWGFDETVTITVETVRTMLDLLDEFPDFTFSQSQGAVYRIVEQYAPETLDRIKRHIHDGRWELTATQWTESDMNLPSGESLVQHAVHTIAYLQDLFAVDRAHFRIAFMPDTFGHGIHTPEILAEAGVRYVYHCRGQEGPYVAWWRAPSGRAVLAYQDPRWYNEPVRPSMLGYVAAIAQSYGTTIVPAVYGVGDHGGGPTRRDIHTIRAMQEWPLAPKIEFGTYRSYFARLAKTAGLPIVEGERNPIFTGCYTSQQRIKEANRQSERALYVAELLDALQDEHSLTDFTESWRTTLFSHFHDILPGSGVPATREFALSGAQEVFAQTRTTTTRLLRSIMSEIEGPVRSTVERLSARFARGEIGDGTSGTQTDTSDGAGVGFKLGSGRLGTASRWPGWVRPYLVFNPVPAARTSLVEVTVWDWPEHEPAPNMVNAAGDPLPCSVRERSTDTYWMHTYVTLAVEVTLEALAYDVVYAVPQLEETRRLYHPYGVRDWLVADRSGVVLENEHVKAVISPEDLRIAELVDKSRGRQLLGAGGAGLVMDREERGHMSSWIERSARQVVVPGALGRVSGRSDSTDVTAWLTWEAEVGRSRVTVRYALEPGSAQLTVTVSVDFKEISSQEIARLAFRAETPAGIEELIADAPGGTIRRQPSPLSVPVQRYAAAVYRGAADRGGAALGVITPNAQAVGADGTQVTVVLLRASTEPDAAPDLGSHTFEIGLTDADASDLRALHERAVARSHPVIVTPFTRSITTPRAGDGRADEKSLPAAPLQADQRGVELLSLRRSRLGKGIVMRLASQDSQGRATYDFGAQSITATVVDALEQRVEDPGAAAVALETVSAEVNGGTLAVTLPANRICTILVKKDR
jgi:alpha-mannosidase